jgi:cytochrome c6
MTPSFKLLLVSAFALGATLVGRAADAPANWKKHCTLCHAADGTGATKQGKKLKLKDYTDPAVQAELKDDEMIRVIKEGVKNDAGKFDMPEYAKKLTDEEIAALITFIRAMKKEG